MKYLLLFTTLLLLTGTVVAERIFVSVNGTPSASGLSWEETTDLITATQRALSGDEIWVQAGTYRTSPTGARKASFKLAAGVILYGGFSGTEVDPDQRQINTRSVLSGEIGDAGATKDNAYTVLTLLADKDASTLVDGFTITAGNARSFTQGFGTANAGGGIYIKKGHGFLTAHQIVNCEFTGNKGHNGAGVFVASGNTSFENCNFHDNVADFKGGAIYNQGAGSEANVRFIDCRFESNGAKYGGAMANNGESGTTNPLLIRCGFVSNVAKSNGAAVYNMTNETGECAIITEQCFFDDNTSILGDDVATKGDKKSMAQLRRNSENSGIIISGAAKR